MKEEKLPRTLQLYVDFMARAGRPVLFTEVQRSGPPRVNKFRNLLQRGLVVNTVKPYTRDEPYTGPRLPLYVLTKKGKAFASSARDPK